MPKKKSRQPTEPSPKQKTRKSIPKPIEKTPIPAQLTPQPTPPAGPQPEKQPEKPPEQSQERVTPKFSERAPIRAHEFDPHFKHEISKMQGGEKLNRCFQCGTCTSDCPIARFSDCYRPRQIIRMAQLGLKDRVLSSDALWLCAACFTCTDRCPQGVEVASVIRILRNASVERGFMPPIFKQLGLSILETTIAYRIPELKLRKREEIGLPPLPKGNPQAILKLAKATGFCDRLQRGEQK